jgi:hypothetical protein
MEAQTQVEDVRFVLFGSEMEHVFQRAMNAEADRTGWTVADGRWESPAP